MNRRAEINPLCVAFVFLALGVVTFLLLHPLNHAASAYSPLPSFFALLLNP